MQIIVYLFRVGKKLCHMSVTGIHRPWNVDSISLVNAEIYLFQTKPHTKDYTILSLFRSGQSHVPIISIDYFQCSIVG